MVENSTRANYYGIAEGKIVQSFKEPVEGLTKTRVNKNNRTVHEAFYDRIRGKIVDIKVRDRDTMGKDWNVTLKDSNGNTEILQFPYSSGYANGFLRALPNLDVTAEVVIAPNLKMEGDKKRTTIFLNQHGQGLKWAFTKDNPNGLPQMVKVRFQGKEQWDDTDQMEFLLNMVNETILPKIKAALPAAPAQAEPVSVELEPEHSGNDNYNPDEQAPF